MGNCKPTYKGKRYNSLEELYRANGVNTQQAQQLYSSYLQTTNNPTIEGFKQWNKRQQQINELFDSNSELANAVYEALGFIGNIIQDSKSYYRGQIEEPTIDKDGNLVLYAKEDELYKKAGLKSKGVSMTDDLQSAIDYGNGQLDVAMNLASETYDRDIELERLSTEGYWLIQIPKNISNEIVKEAGEVKIISDKIIIPKGQYKIEQIVEGLETQITPQQKQQAQQLYSQYLDTIFPESKVKDIVYHGTPKISKDNAYERLNLWEQYQDDLITEEEYNERIKQFPENPVIEKFDKSKIGSQSNSGLKKGFYFSTNKKVALWNESNNLYRAIVNSVNPQTIEGDSKKINFSKLKEATEKGDVVYKNTIDALENNTELLGDTIVVQEPEQIHILGSKQDIEGFKAFVESNNTKTNNSELIDKNTESEIKPIVDAENKTIKNNYEIFKEVQGFFDSNLSTMDNVYNAIFNNSEITPDDIIKQIIKTDNVEKECNGGVSDSSWEIV